METALELDSAGSKFADSRNVLDSLVDGIPCRVVFVGGRITGRFDRFEAQNQRVQFDYFAMAVQNVQRELPGYKARDRRDVDVCRLLPGDAHGDGGRWS